MDYSEILLGLKTLSNRCDGARQLDNAGFSRFDAEIGKSLASKSSLTDRQAKVGRSLVIKYGGQLDSDLVDRVKSLEITIHTPSIETAINTLKWSAPKIVKGGTLQLEEANPTDSFWAVWKENKEILKPQGYSVAKDKFGNWKVNKWTTLSVAPKEEIPSSSTASTPISNITVPEIPEDLIAKLLPHQSDIVNTLVKSLAVSGCAFDASDCGCHAKGAKILMFDGSIKLVEDIEVCEKIMGWDGQPRTVLQLKRGNQQMAEIVPIKGNSFIVNKSHVLSLIPLGEPNRNPRCNGQVVDVTVEDWLNWNPTKKLFYKLFRTPIINSWGETSQPIDPYFLGILLGDGCLIAKYPISVTKPGEVIRQLCYEQAKKWGGKIYTQDRNDYLSEGHINKDNKNNPSYIFREVTKLKSNLQELKIDVEGKEKFVPGIYKICSFNQRSAILAGLLDSDGSLSRGGFDFISCSEKLASDVAFLARSLGLAAYIKKCQKGCQNGFVGIYHRVSISGDCSILPLRIKIPNHRKQIKNVLRTGFQVNLLNNDDFYGFTLSGDGRYLMGDFTVTHNSGKTFSSLAAAKVLGKKVLAICPKSGIPGWERAMEYLGVEGTAINYEQVKTGNTKWGCWRSNIIEDSKGNKKTVETFEWNLCDDVYVVIWDECHRLKNRDTINSQIAIAAKLQGIKIILLSATAASNPLEMKALGYILDLFPLKKYWDWAGNHGVRKGRFGMEFSGGSYYLERIHNSIFKANPPKGVRIRTKDIPGFPECLIISEALDFDGENPKIQAAYDDMQHEIERLKERMGKDAGACILTEILRARQKIELLKIPTLAEMAEDLVAEGNSVVVCLSFKESIHALANKLKTTCIIDGDNVGEKREQNRLAFQRGQERICILSILCGESIDLDDQLGDFPRVELLCPDMSAQRIIQSIGRIHRAKSLSKAIVKFCFATGTIEDRAREIVMQKARNIETLNDADMAMGLNI